MVLAGVDVEALAVAGRALILALLAFHHLHVATALAVTLLEVNSVDLSGLSDREAETKGKHGDYGEAHVVVLVVVCCG